MNRIKAFIDIFGFTISESNCPFCTDGYEGAEVLYGISNESDSVYVSFAGVYKQTLVGYSKNYFPAGVELLDLYFPLDITVNGYAVVMVRDIQSSQIPISPYFLLVLAITLLSLGIRLQYYKNTL